MKQKTVCVFSKKKFLLFVSKLCKTCSNIIYFVVWQLVVYLDRKNGGCVQLNLSMLIKSARVNFPAKISETKKKQQFSYICKMSHDLKKIATL